MRNRLIAITLGVLAVLALGLSALAAPSAVGAPAPAVAPAAGPTAAQLLAKTQNCKQVSHGKYKTDEDSGSATVPICGAANGTVFFKADMDIDCDGQRTAQCNEKTDCCFQPDTSFHQSDGKPLSAARLPYVVLPLPSSVWSYKSAGFQGGDVIAVIYDNKVEYAVFGDEGPKTIIGESSYATAKALGIDPDPKTGGVDSGVTYIVFKSKVGPIENHDNAVTLGEKLAQQFVDGN